MYAIRDSKRTNMMILNNLTGTMPSSVLNVATGIIFNAPGRVPNLLEGFLQAAHEALASA